MVARVLSVVLKIVIGFKEGESGFFNHFFRIPKKMNTLCLSELDSNPQIKQKRLMRQKT